MSNTKPFVAIAALCEKILEERDGVMTAVRLVDTFFVATPPGSAPDAKPVIVVTGLIALKSGDVTGTHAIRLVLENTRGARTEVSPEGGWPVVFKGGEHGVQIRMDFQFTIENYGLAWFDVIFDDGDVLTRIPIRLRRAEEREIRAEGPS